jgi:hypothetical protein
MVVLCRKSYVEATKAHVIKLSEHLPPGDESTGIRIDHATKEQAVSDINREIDAYLGAGLMPEAST